MLREKNNILKLLILALMLVVSLTVLAGCGKEKDNNKQNAENNGNTSNTANNASENGNQQVNNENNADNNQSTSKTISRGKWDDKVYTSEFANLKFTLPDGWTRSTDEEIAKTMQLGEEVLKNEELYISEISKLNVIYDMMAKNTSTNGSVAVMMEKSVGNAKEYAEALKAQLGQVTQMNYTIGDFTETKIGGNTYTVVPAKASVSGANVLQNYYLRDEGEYVVAILITETSQENLDKVINSFK